MTDLIVRQGPPELFFADERHYRIALLPSDGFVPTDFTELARAASFTGTTPSDARLTASHPRR